jgi:hypothetical protein
MPNAPDIACASANCRSTSGAKVASARIIVARVRAFQTSPATSAT